MSRDAATGRFRSSGLSTWLRGRETIPDDAPLEGAKREVVAAEVAHRAGLAPIWADRLRGSTAAELEADAEGLVDQVGSSSRRLSRFLRGGR